jgi:hypothetical protein
MEGILDQDCQALVQRSRVRDAQDAAILLVHKHAATLAVEPLARYDLLLAYSRLTLASRTLGMSNDPFVVAIKQRVQARSDFVPSRRLPTGRPPVTDDD